MFALILALGAATVTIVQARQVDPIPHCFPCEDSAR
jgi:hypothetical protein